MLQSNRNRTGPTRARPAAALRRPQARRGTGGPACKRRTGATPHWRMIQRGCWCTTCRIAAAAASVFLYLVASHIDRKLKSPQTVAANLRLRLPAPGRRSARLRSSWTPARGRGASSISFRSSCISGQNPLPGLPDSPAGAGASRDVRPTAGAAAEVRLLNPRLAPGRWRRNHS